MKKKIITRAIVLGFLLAFLILLLCFGKQMGIFNRKDEMASALSSSAFLKNGASCSFLNEKGESFQMKLDSISFEAIPGEEDSVTVLFDLCVNFSGEETFLPVYRFYALFGQNDGFAPEKVVYGENSVEKGESCSIISGESRFSFQFQVPSDLADLHFDLSFVLLYVTLDGEWNQSAPIIAA